MKEKHCTGSCRLCETATMLFRQNTNRVASDVNNDNRFCFLTDVHNNNGVPDMYKKKYNSGESVVNHLRCCF